MTDNNKKTDKNDEAYWDPANLADYDSLEEMIAGTKVLTDKSKDELVNKSSTCKSACEKCNCNCLKADKCGCGKILVVVAGLTILGGLVFAALKYEDERDQLRDQLLNTVKKLKKDLS